jgi:hypothetical protein
MAAILPLHLPDHLPTLLISTVGFAAIHHLGAPEFARFLLGKNGWDALGSRERVGWCVFFHVIPPFIRHRRRRHRMLIEGRGACPDHSPCNL